MSYIDLREQITGMQPGRVLRVYGSRGRLLAVGYRNIVICRKYPYLHKLRKGN